MPPSKGVERPQIFLWTAYIRSNGFTYGDEIWCGNVWVRSMFLWFQPRPRPKGSQHPQKF